jgi:FAD-dependent halogenase
MSNQEDFDLIVVGGGPGGSTVATLVAMQNHRVLLLERERFPRHQIGESLLPSTIHGVCTMLGLQQELERAGFVKKYGGTFRWGKNPAPWTIKFGMFRGAIAGPDTFAYQVERSKFDKLLLDNARCKGVDVREEHKVTEVLTEGGRVAGVRFVDHAGMERTARARYVADASGHQSLISKQVGERRFSKFFQNIALYCYYENGKRLPPPGDGNVLSVSFKQGWFWYIPLSKTLTSVGAVVGKEHADRLKLGRDVAMQSFIDQCPMIKDFLSPATRITEGLYGEYRIRKDYSYSVDKFWIPGLVLIGDAACFIDPVFSSGVHLATYSALLAARSINTCLSTNLDEERCFQEFEARYRREFGNFYNFLAAFYDLSKDEDSYFWTARKILNSEETAYEAFIQLISGSSQPGERLFTNEQFFELTEGRQDPLRSSAQTPAASEIDDNIKLERFVELAGFADEFVTEMAHLQTLAALGANCPPSQPLFPMGLIPSADGFRWREVPNGQAAD